MPSTAPAPRPASAPKAGPIGRARRVIVAAFGRFQNTGMTHHAAAMTYYTMLSLFPGLIVGVALLGLLGQADTADRFSTYLASQGASPDLVRAVHSLITNAVDASGGKAGLTLVIGIVLGLYGASGALGAAGRALNEAYGVDEGRGFVRRKATDLGATVLVIALILIAFALVFLGGGLTHDLFDAIGLGATAADIWNLLRWPMAIVVAMVGYGLVYYAAPNVHNRRFSWITPGAVAAVTIWIIASVGFFLYVESFASYNATYGAFAGAAILLVWLWLTNVALLFGAEVNVELRRAPITVRVEPDDDSPEDPAT